MSATATSAQVISPDSTSKVSFSGEAEFMGWGNLSGVRLQGELFPFRTSIRIVGTRWDVFEETAQNQRQQNPRFFRDDSVRSFSATIDPISIVETVTSVAEGVADLQVDLKSTADTTLDGIYFLLELVKSDYADGSFGFRGTERTGDDSISISVSTADVGNDYVRASATGLRFGSSDRSLEIAFEEPAEVIVRDETSDSGQQVLRAYVTLLRDEIEEGQGITNTFRLSVDGVVDTEPVDVVVESRRPGRAFDGVGGSFRIQNPPRDSLVIAYSLEHLPVAWGRVEMPWRWWQAELDSDPIAAAEAGNLHPRVASAMLMARTLARNRTPILVTAWYPPNWAVVNDAEAVSDSRLGAQADSMGTDSVRTDATTTGSAPTEQMRPEADLRGRPLNEDRMSEIVQSIGDYLVYLKREYGVEASLFSFNSPDLGVDVRLTAEEHARFIATMGKYLAERGLATRMLLGDASSGFATDYIKSAITNKDARPYIGAVSFHSWSGRSDEVLEYWGDAARLLNVPLLVSEAGTDALAYRYPAVFSESSYAVSEIELYMRILSLAEPTSILQWQLTADFSVLRGGGLYGVADEPLTPTQRYWNLKQLSTTPAGAFSLPVTCANAAVSCAAFGDIVNGEYLVHVVNNGAGRRMTLSGLPGSVQELVVLVTDSERSMEPVDSVVRDSGTYSVDLPPVSYVTIVGR